MKADAPPWHGEALHKEDTGRPEFLPNITAPSLAASLIELRLHGPVEFVTGFPDRFYNPVLPVPARAPPHWRGDQTLFREPPCGKWSDLS